MKNDIVSFFAGVGGIDLGFEDAGEYRTVYANEFDDNKYDIYFTFRNYSGHSRLYTINLLTDVNWKTKENSTHMQ